ncbi:MAG: HAD hydrolase-like protein [Candidatus Gracilibacteria bacterium]|nr:HAD hydrolase-like protein [Candidatus Gracilibacteria bacterium]
MKKEYLIFDMDGTLVHSMNSSMEVIYDYIKKIDSELLDKSRYVFENTMGTPLIRQIETIFEGDYNHQKITDEIYEELLHLETEFFPGVIEKIKELSANYTLFLTTGNSTPTAMKHLEEGGIKDNFAIILGSDKLLKGRDHIEEFIRYSCDDDFCQKAVYTGDGEGDKLFSGQFDIDFIRIGKFGKDKYEINSVAEIDEILEILN